MYFIALKTEFIFHFENLTANKYFAMTESENYAKEIVELLNDMDVPKFSIMKLFSGFLLNSFWELIRRLNQGK